MALVAILFRGGQHGCTTIAREGDVFHSLALFQGMVVILFCCTYLIIAQGLWPLCEAPIADCLNAHLDEQAAYCMDIIQKYTDVTAGKLTICMQGGGLCKTCWACPLNNLPMVCHLIHCTQCPFCNCMKPAHQCEVLDLHCLRSTYDTKL